MPTSREHHFVASTISRSMRTPRRLAYSIQRMSALEGISPATSRGDRTLVRPSTAHGLHGESASRALRDPRPASSRRDDGSPSGAWPNSALRRAIELPPLKLRERGDADEISCTIPRPSPEGRRPGPRGMVATLAGYRDGFRHAVCVTTFTRPWPVCSRRDVAGMSASLDDGRFKGCHSAAAARRLERLMPTGGFRWWLRLFVFAVIYTLTVASGVPGSRATATTTTASLTAFAVDAIRDGALARLPRHGEFPRKSPTDRDGPA